MHIRSFRLVFCFVLTLVSLARASSEGTEKVRPPARVPGAPTLTPAFVTALRGAEDEQYRLVVVGDTELRHKAFGPFQVRQPCVTDVNRVYGTNFKAEDCQGNLELSVWMFEAYMSIYATPKRLGHTATYEDMVRIWNGGPNGHKKESTRAHWIKARKFWPKPQIQQIVTVDVK